MFSEAVAAPAVSAPVTAPTTAPATQAAPDVASPDASTPAEAKAARVELAKMDPATIVTMIVGGKEVEMTADKAWKMLGRAESADKRFKEAADSRKEIAGILDDLESSLGDPREFAKRLKQFGLNPKQFAEVMSAYEDEEAALTPEQRRIRELEAAQKEHETKAQAEERRAFNAEKTRIRAAYQSRFDAIMTESGIPTDHVARDYITPKLFEYAAYLRSGDPDNGVEPREMRASDVRNVVRHFIDQNRTLGGPPPQLAPAPAPVVEPPRLAAPPLPPRGEDGKFQPAKPPNGMVPNRTSDGRPVVRNLSDLFD